jgi:hypothetical protein
VIRHAGGDRGRHGWQNRRAGFTGTQRMSLKKLLDFFDPDMLQLFDFEPRPYRSNGSI